MSEEIRAPAELTRVRWEANAEYWVKVIRERRPSATPSSTSSSATTCSATCTTWRRRSGSSAGFVITDLREPHPADERLQHDPWWRDAFLAALFILPTAERR